MSLQRAAFRAWPTRGLRWLTTSPLSRVPIQVHTHRLPTSQRCEAVVQIPSGSCHTGAHNVCFGNAARRVPASRTLFQVHQNSGFKVVGQTFATKAVQQEAEAKWWESLGQFLRGCRRRSNRFNIRKLLWKLGIPYWKIEKPWKKARRAYKHSWLSTMVSAGVTVAIGDILAQAVYPVLFANGKSSKNLSGKDIRKKIDSICDNMKQINVCRTLQFAVLAALFVGPLSRLITRRFMLGTLKYPEGSYTAQLIIKDALLLTPLVISMYMIGYDYRSAIDTTKKVTEISKKDKNTSVKELATKRISMLKDEISKRYKKPFMDMFIFYISTAPLVKMVQAFGMVPKKNGLLLAKLYKLIFFCFLSHSITSNQLGPEITKRKSLKEIKNGNKGGGGGWVCIAAGAVAAMFTRAEKELKNDKKKEIKNDNKKK